MNPRFVLVWAACFVTCAGTVAGVAAALWAVLPEDERLAAERVLAATGDLPYLLGIGLVVATGFVAKGLVDLWLRPARRMAEAVRLITEANPGHRAEAEGGAELRDLAEAVNGLATRHARLLAEVDERVVQARMALEAERNRLAALMSELAQSVVVCNAEGRVLLYNERARRFFGNGSGEGGFLGLGRSVFALLDRDLVAHAVEQLRERSARGEHAPVAVFIAALGSGGLARVRMAPVAGGEEAGALAGFVMLLEDVAAEVERAERRDRILHELVEGIRASSASARAAVENLLHFPEMPVDRRQQFTEIIRDEAGAVTRRLDEATRAYSELLRSQWSLEQMRAADLVAIIGRRLESRLGLQVRHGDVDAGAWVSVDSFAIAQGASYFATRLRDEYDVKFVELALSKVGRHVRLDVLWHGPRLSTATILSWESDPLEAGGEASPLTLREILDRHRAEAWYEPGRAVGRATYRILLPLAEPAQAPARGASPGSRPEYYDFDLFAQPGQSHALDDRPLRDLSYTVFDTETTGLEPSAGDEIISIGAVRIVNQRVLAGEAYEQLVDPQRPIGKAAVEVHGITAEMLAGQPTIGRVLPAFHRYCEETVLVGHNVAFDMRFLQMKEDATGVRFTQPVLDTLLLSAVLHADLESHKLEAIAQRLGIAVIGRHTALGDAIVTAEVFVRMIPLLAERGIVTLRQALDAAQQSYYARIRY